MKLPESPARLLDIAVVGTGGRAQSHLETIQTLTDLFRLSAVCDVMPGRAQEVGERLGVPGFSKLDEMLEKQRPDVVLVTVPPEYHHTVACRAAEYGASVICETPIAIGLPYADDMIRTAAEHGVAIEVAENVWRHPEERFKRMLLDSGMLGKVQVMRMHYSAGSYHGMSAVRNLITSTPVRAVGLARLMNAPKKVRYVDPFHFRSFGPQGDDPPAHLSESDLASWEAGIIEFDDGAVASYEFPIIGPTGRGWDLQTTEGWMSLTEVALVNEPARRYRIVTEYNGEGDERVLTSVRLYDGDRPLSDVVWENPFSRYRTKGPDDVARIDQLVSIYRSVTEGIEPEYDGAEGRKDMELLIAVRESARQGGQPVSLPLTEVTGYEERLFPVYGRPQRR